MQLSCEMLATWVASQMRRFVKDESGAGELIAAVVVIAIVVVIGVMFHDRIIEFFGTLWDSATGNATTVTTPG